nr:Flp family type IVb pilin [Bacillota bacterium]
MSLVARRAVGTARSQRGATTAEYALVLALVAIALIGVLGQLGQALDMRLDEIIDQISGAGKE